MQSCHKTLFLPSTILKIDVIFNSGVTPAKRKSYLTTYATKVKHST